MFTVSVDLRLLGNTCDARKKHKGMESSSGGGENADGESAGYEYAERTVEFLMNCFRNLCTDTRSESQVETGRETLVHSSEIT
jgi:hypothetical protein